MKNVEEIKNALTINSFLNRATFIDVRSYIEYVHGHIDKAICYPLEQIENVVEELNDLPKPIILYSVNGTRSKLAFDQLKHAIPDLYNGGSLGDLKRMLGSKLGL